MGRFTDFRKGKILEALKAGHTRNGACGLAGIDPSVLSKRAARSPTLAMELAEAEHVAEARMVNVVIKAAINGDARTALEWLKRRRREDWGDSLAVRLERMTNDQLADYLAGSPLAIAAGGVDSSGDREAARHSDGQPAD